jgi:hypothetical protein
LEERYSGFWWHSHGRSHWKKDILDSDGTVMADPIRRKIFWFLMAQSWQIPLEETYYGFWWRSHGRSH